MRADTRIHICQQKAPTAEAGITAKIKFLMTSTPAFSSYHTALALGRNLISPTHKQTEGRAPVWCSEFTIKVTTLKGDSADIAPTPNVKLWVLVVRGD
jgi:hypothetical protein